jgi:hypothetical protein
VQRRVSADDTWGAFRAPPATHSVRRTTTAPRRIEERREGDGVALHASWTHGTAFQPAERPLDGLSNVDGIAWTDVVGLRQGWGASYNGNAGRANWFHVPIPTPVIVAGARAKLVKVFVMFRCGDPAGTNALSQPVNVTDIHVWDGANRIATFGPFNLFGEHRFRLDTSNTHALRAPRDVIFGIGLSVRVAFRFGGTVTFAAAGADFEV